MLETRRRSPAHHADHKLQERSTHRRRSPHHPAGKPAGFLCVSADSDVGEPKDAVLGPFFDVRNISWSMSSNCLRSGFGRDGGGKEGHTKDSSPARGTMGSSAPRGATRPLLPRTQQRGRRSSEPSRTARSGRVPPAPPGEPWAARTSRELGIKHALRDRRRQAAGPTLPRLRSRRFDRFGNTRHADG